MFNKRLKNQLAKQQEILNDQSRQISAQQFEIAGLRNALEDYDQMKDATFAVITEVNSETGIQHALIHQLPNGARNVLFRAETLSEVTTVMRKFVKGKVLTFDAKGVEIKQPKPVKEKTDGSKSSKKVKR